jgi:hypothetical protein
MSDVAHVIPAIDVHDINVIRVAPTERPRIEETERVAAVREAPAVIFALVDVEIVPAAKTRRVMGVGNTAVRTAAASSCRA